MTLAAACIPPSKAMAFSRAFVFMHPLSTNVDLQSTSVVGANKQMLFNGRMAMGKRILERINELGWNQTDLCSCVPDLEPQALNALIRRDSKSSSFAPKIADALGLQLKYLMTGEEPKLLQGVDLTAKIGDQENTTTDVEAKNAPKDAQALAARIVRMSLMKSLPPKAIKSIDGLLDTIEQGSQLTPPPGRNKYEHNQSALEAKAIRNTPANKDQDDTAAGQN